MLLLKGFFWASFTLQEQGSNKTLTARNIVEARLSSPGLSVRRLANMPTPLARSKKRWAV